MGQPQVLLRFPLILLLVSIFPHDVSAQIGSDWFMKTAADTRELLADALSDAAETSASLADAIVAKPISLYLGRRYNFSVWCQLPNYTSGHHYYIITKSNCHKVRQAQSEFTSLVNRTSTTEFALLEWPKILSEAQKICNECDDVSGGTPWRKSCAYKAVEAWGKLVLRGRECCNSPFPPFCSKQGKSAHYLPLAFVLFVCAVAVVSKYIMPQCTAPYFWEKVSNPESTPIEQLPRDDDRHELTSYQMDHGVVKVKLKEIWERTTLCKWYKLRHTTGNTLGDRGVEIFTSLYIMYGFQKDSVLNQFENFLSAWRSHVSVVADVKIQQGEDPDEDGDLLKDALLGMAADQLEGFNLWRKKVLPKWWEQMAEKDSAGNAYISIMPQCCLRAGEDAKCSSPEHRMAEAAMFLLIWGEASNLRFMPEMLYFITQLALEAEYSDVKKGLVDESGELMKCPKLAISKPFLVTIVRPIYNHVFNENVEKSEGKGRVYHKDKTAYMPPDCHNYDDWDELFNEQDRLKNLTLKLGEEKAKATVLMEVKENHRYSKLPIVDWAKSLANCKTHREVHSMWGVFAATHRIWFLHTILFVLAMWLANAPWAWPPRKAGNRTWVAGNSPITTFSTILMVIPIHGVIWKISRTFTTGQMVIREESRRATVGWTLFFLTTFGTYAWIRYLEYNGYSVTRADQGQFCYNGGIFFSKRLCNYVMGMAGGFEFWCFLHFSVCVFGAAKILFMAARREDALWDKTEPTTTVRCVRGAFWILVFGSKFIVGYFTILETMNTVQRLRLVEPGKQALQDLFDFGFTPGWDKDVIQWFALYGTGFIVFFSDTQFWVVLFASFLGVLIGLYQRTELDEPPRKPCIRCIKRTKKRRESCGPMNWIPRIAEITFEDPILELPERMAWKVFRHAVVARVKDDIGENKGITKKLLSGKKINKDERKDYKLKGCERFCKGSADKLGFANVWDEIIQSMYNDDKIDAEDVEKMCYQIKRKKPPQAPANSINRDNETGNARAIHLKPLIFEEGVVRAWARRPSDNEEVQYRIEALARGMTLTTAAPYQIPFLPGLTVMTPHYADSQMCHWLDLFPNAVNFRYNGSNDKLEEYLEKMRIGAGFVKGEWSKKLVFEYEDSDKIQIHHTGIGPKDLPEYTDILVQLKHKEDAQDLIPLMDWLKYRYSKEYSNFFTRKLMTNRNATDDDTTEDIVDIAFSRPGDYPYDDYEKRFKERDFVTEWASMRSQTLWRTVKGMCLYSDALRWHYELQGFKKEDKKEDKDRTHWTMPDVLDSPLWKEFKEKFKAKDKDTGNEIIKTKMIGQTDAMIREIFTYVLTMQIYSDFADKHEGGYCVGYRFANKMLKELPPSFTIAFLAFQKKNTEEEEDGIHKKIENRVFSCLIDKFCEEEPQDDKLKELGKDNSTRKPKYKIELPGFPILGEGKGDNQNHAVIFTRGSIIQCIDANQGAYFEQMLLLPCVLGEFRVNLKPGQDNKLEPVDKHHRKYGLMKKIVGFPEHITSDIGSTGNFAAGAEMAFGTTLQRSYAVLGSRMHYGHPDMMNKTFIMQQGGVSKASKCLHLSEDIFAGMDFTLRGNGRQIEHCEYFCVSKGRDLGFATVLIFFAKLSSGTGEQVLTRQMFRLGHVLGLGEFMGFYYAHAGYYMGQFLLSKTVPLFTFIWLMVILDDPEGDFKRFDAGEKGYSGAEAMSVLLGIGFSWVMLLFIAAQVVPLIFELGLQQGVVFAVKKFAAQVLTFAPIHFIFQAKIIGVYITNEVLKGGAKYMATGRGLPTVRNAFMNTYTSWAENAFYDGFRLMCFWWMAALTGGLFNVKEGEAWMGNCLIGWIIAAHMTFISWLFTPFLFNPYQFHYGAPFWKDWSEWKKFFFADKAKKWKAYHDGKLEEEGKIRASVPAVMTWAISFGCWYTVCNSKMYVLSTFGTDTRAISIIGKIPPVISSLVVSALTSAIMRFCCGRSDLHLKYYCIIVVFCNIVETFFSLRFFIYVGWWKTLLAGIMLKYLGLSLALMCASCLVRLTKASLDNRVYRDVQGKAQEFMDYNENGVVTKVNGEKHKNLAEAQGVKVGWKILEESLPELQKLKEELQKDSNSERKCTVKFEVPDEKKDQDECCTCGRADGPKNGKKVHIHTVKFCKESDTEAQLGMEWDTSSRKVTKVDIQQLAKDEKNWKKTNDDGKEEPWEIIEVQNEDERKAFHKDCMSGFEQKNEGKYRITFVKKKESICTYCKVETALILKNWLEAHRMAFDLIISLFLFGIVATFVLIGRLTESFMPGVSIHNYIVYRDMGHMKTRTKEDDAGNSQRGEDTEMADKS